MSPDRGDVVWSDDPFKDDPEAGRPWLTLNTDAIRSVTNNIWP